MTYSSPSISPDATISQDKMDKIIEAVIDGKYSYACLVILEEAGYDPAHYIPYRTYNRLQKQHQAVYQSIQKSTVKVASVKVASLEPKIERAKRAAKKRAAPEIADIDYVDSIQGQENAFNGGYGIQPSGAETASIKVPFWQAGLRLCGYST